MVATVRPALEAFPASTKVYLSGSRPDIRVPMREISLSPTRGQYGNEDNPPLRVYDTSGPYTDPACEPDIRQGLPAYRLPWILERGDVEEYEGRSIHPRDNGYRLDDPRANMQEFPGLKRSPLRA